MKWPIDPFLGQMALGVCRQPEKPLAKVKRLIREDRAACNDGRWRRVFEYRHRDNSAPIRLPAGIFGASQPFPFLFGWVHPINRYRWEYRR